MLRSLGIRSKILAVLALPVLVLLLAASVIGGGAVNDARRATQVEALAGQAADLSRLVRGLQTERALSAALLSGDASVRPQLDEARGQVSGGIEAVRGGVGAVNLDLLDDDATAAVEASLAAHAQVEALRRQVDSAALTPALATDAYTEVITADVELAARLANAVQDPALASQLRAYSSVERLAESIATERDLVAPAVAARQLTPALRQQLTALVSRQDVLRAEATRQAESAGVRIPSTGYTMELARQRTALDADGVLDGITVEEWREAADADVAALTQAQGRLASEATSRASSLADEAFWWAWQVVGMALLAVIVPVVLALYLARTITRPLTRLTEAAGEIRRELPAMVERMATPGEGPGVTLPEIPVTARDEVGRLAEAFNDVNSTTVRVAQEQAALRGSIAEMFVNVARRDQVLLSRQLAFIDQLERREDDPATLNNLFKLDHLATRMRRNAESLLVLAGIDTGRRLRRPMPLSDVVRTAYSEIEHYERVDLVLGTDPPMVGHVALSAAHLLAELLENATNFSDPTSRVLVRTATGQRGVVVRITDRGLGMSAEELAEANARIADASVNEVVGAQRLGFFVVGRLARRLDATVTLSAGEDGGTVAVVEFPAALFTPGSVVELPARDDDDPVELAAPLAPAVPAPPAVPAAPLGGAAALAGARPAPAPVTRPDGLPQRRRGATETPAPPSPAPAPAGAADTATGRGGLFSGFRARRPGEAATEAAPSVPAERPSSAPAEVPSSEPAGEPVAVIELQPQPALVTRTPSTRPTPPAAPVAPARRQTPVTEAAPQAAARPHSEPRPHPEPRPEPVQDAVATEAEATELPTSPMGTPALNILPSRSSRRVGKHVRAGLPSRRQRETVPAGQQAAALPTRPQPAQAASPVAAPAPPEDRPAHQPASFPAAAAASRPASPPAQPVQPAQSAPSAPSAQSAQSAQPAQPAQSAGPVPAPSSLFTYPGQGLAPTSPTAAAPSAPASTRSAGDVSAADRDQRSALASEALTELSLLSSYRPTVEAKPPATLTRRTPAATPAAQVASPSPAAASRRHRNAAEVRSMLAGFQAGVERGRTSPQSPAMNDQTTPDTAPRPEDRA